MQACCTPACPDDFYNNSVTRIPPGPLQDLPVLTVLHGIAQKVSELCYVRMDSVVISALLLYIGHGNRVSGSILHTVGYAWGKTFSDDDAPVLL